MDREQGTGETASANAVAYCEALIFDIWLEGKGKSILLQAWTGPEGSRSLRLPDFKTIGT
jgi:hypothetical protein